MIFKEVLQTGVRMMQLLINIDETDKQEIDKLLKGKGIALLDNAQLIKIAVLAIFHGTPLPKGHGDLKDMKNLRYVFDLTTEEHLYSGKDIERAVKSMIPIIKADRSEVIK